MFDKLTIYKINDYYKILNNNNIFKKKQKYIKNEKSIIKKQLLFIERFF